MSSNKYRVAIDGMDPLTSRELDRFISEADGWLKVSQWQRHGETAAYIVSEQTMEDVALKLGHRFPGKGATVQFMEPADLDKLRSDLAAAQDRRRRYNHRAIVPKGA